MGFSLDDLNPFSGNGILAGGAGDRGKAAANSKKAAQAWEDFQNQYQTGQYDPANLGVTYDPTNTDPNMLHAYEAGPKQTAVQEGFLTPEQAAAKGLQADSMAMWSGPSAWEGDQSAFSSRAPSAWDDYSSAYGDLGPSTYGDLAYDPGARSRMEQAGDYFGNLSSTGNDPIAEADFQRRTAAAEASRKANTDAALAAEEAKGMGSGSGRLLAELSNQQASVGDQYLAGLDANAMAAGRRDNAAMQGAGIGQMIGQGQLAADTARAGGMDQYALAQAQGQDVAGAARAAGSGRATRWTTGPTSVTATTTV